MPGNVNTVMSRVTWLAEILKCSFMDGNAGEMLDTPITATSVIKYIVARFRFSMLLIYSGKSRIFIPC